MLILARREEESILIHTGREVIEVRVTEVRNGIVRLGFVAPEHVEIWRKELDWKRERSLK